MNRNNFIYRFVLLSALCWISSNLYAQDGLGDQQVNVIKPYQPILSDGYKISEVPARDTINPSAPVFDYEVIPKPFKSSFDVTPIKPSRQSDYVKPVFGKHFIKGGVGFADKNFMTYAEGFGTFYESKELSSGIHIRHLAAQGESVPQTRGLSSNSGDVFLHRFMELSSLKAVFDFERKVMHDYGYDKIYDVPDSYKRRYVNVNPSLRWKSENPDKSAMFYDAGLQYNYLNLSSNDWNFIGTSSGSAQEHNIVFDGGAGVKSKLIGYGMDMLVDYNIVNRLNPIAGNTSFTHGIITLNPKAYKQGKIWTMTTGTKLTFNPHKDIKGTHKWNPRLYSDVDFSVRIFENILTAFGKIGGGVIKNNLKNLTDQNPHFTPNTFLIYSRNTLDLRAGLTGAWSSRTHWIASAGFDLIEDMPFFESRWSGGRDNQFTVSYDNVEIFNAHGGIRQTIGRDFSLNLEGDYFHYAMDKLPEAWYKPEAELNLSAKYNAGTISFLSFVGPGNWIIGTEILFVGSRMAPKNFTDTSGIILQVPVKLKPYLDANLSIDYKLERLSFFLHLNNLSATAYHRWLNYPVHGFNVLLGAGYAF